MTLPDERYRSLVQTRRFLLDLCNTKHTPGVPKLIRDTARSMLRHYPSDFDLDEIERYAPHVIQQRLEPLYKMIKQHELDSDNKNTP